MNKIFYLFLVPQVSQQGIVSFMLYKVCVNIRKLQKLSFLSTFFAYYIYLEIQLRSLGNTPPLFLVEPGIILKWVCMILLLPPPPASEISGTLEVFFFFNFF